MSSNVASACQALDNVAMGKKVVVHESLKKSKVEGVPTDPACGKAGVHSSALGDAVDRASVQQGAPALHTGGQIGTQARSGLTGGCWHRRRCALATDRSARRARQARSRGGGLEHGLGVAAEAFRSVTLCPFRVVSYERRRSISGFCYYAIPLSPGEYPSQHRVWTKSVPECLGGRM